MEEEALLIAGRSALQTLKTIVGVRNPTKDAQGFELTSARRIEAFDVGRRSIVSSGGSDCDVGELNGRGANAKCRLTVYFQRRI